MSASFNLQRRPNFKVPPKSCDAHCHVFGPAKIFPYSENRKYTPVDAPKETLFTLHKNLGFERAVLVQASCHGTDNSAMLDMLEHSDGNYRGVAIVDESVTKDQLKAMHAAGVRGIRFNFLKRLVDVKPKEYYLKIAAMVADLGWHIVVYFESENLSSIRSLLSELPAPLVIDHMGRPDVSLGVQGESFQNICRLIDEHPDNWIKVSCVERLSKAGAPYSDVIPFAKYIVNQFSNQVLWGTDFPHPNMEPAVPDDVLLVDNIPKIAINAQLQKLLLVDNPNRLYEFDN